MKILYEDNHLIAVFKEAGVLTQGDRSGDVSLLEQVKAFLKQRDKKPGNVFVGLLHRLDRPVEGVVLFAKTSKGASRLSEQFRSREVRKVYQAWVEGKAPEKGRLEHTVDEKPATLTFRRLEGDETRTHLEIELETGRKHQIRIQLAAAGHPILGDTKYGAKTPWKKGIALRAVRLEFNQPVTGERIVVEQL